jgi:hypothetical protein
MSISNGAILIKIYHISKFSIIQIQKSSFFLALPQKQTIASSQNQHQKL